MTDIKYPEITVELIGKNGNIFNLIACCLDAMRRAGLDKQERDNFEKEVTSARNYNEALQIIMSWVDVE